MPKPTEFEWKTRDLAHAIDQALARVAGSEQLSDTWQRKLDTEKSVSSLWNRLWHWIHDERRP